MPISSATSTKPCASCAAAERRAELSLAARLMRRAALPLIGLVRAYQLVLSPWIGHGCRFQPTCSHYALDALRAHGAARGSWLALRRILRCHPWGGSGYDPAPVTPDRRHSHPQA